MTKQLTIRQLCEMSPWDIASHLGIHYTGDINPLDHDGCFYESKHWVDSGYANALRFTSAENTLYVERCTINLIEKDFSAAFKCVGFDTVSKVPVQQIEVMLSYWGAEIDDTKTFKRERYSSINEYPVWKAVRSWLYSLKED